MKIQLPTRTRFRALVVTFPVGVALLLVVLLAPHDRDVLMTVVLPLVGWMLCATLYRMMAMGRGTER